MNPVNPVGLLHEESIHSQRLSAPDNYAAKPCIYSGLCVPPRFMGNHKPGPKLLLRTLEQVPGLFGSALVSWERLLPSFIYKYIYIYTYSCLGMYAAPPQQMRSSWLEPCKMGWGGGGVYTYLHITDLPKHIVFTCLARNARNVCM